MTNKSKDKIFQWTEHAHNLLVGKCSHGCAYCYAPDMHKVHDREIEHEAGGQHNIEVRRVLQQGDKTFGGDYES